MTLRFRYRAVRTGQPIPSLGGGTQRPRAIVDVGVAADSLSGVVAGIRAAFDAPDCASFGGIAIRLTHLRAHTVDSSHTAFRQAAEQAFNLDVVGRWPWRDAWE